MYHPFLILLAGYVALGVGAQERVEKKSPVIGPEYIRQLKDVVSECITDKAYEEAFRGQSHLVTILEAMLEKAKKEQPSADREVERLMGELADAHLLCGLIGHAAASRREVARLEAQVRAGSATVMELEQARIKLARNEKRLAELRQK